MMKPMKVVNLTPHEIVVVSNGKRIVYPPSGQVARLISSARHLNIEGLPEVVEIEYVGVEGLPQPEFDTVYLTSQLVAQYAAGIGRLDVLAPDTDPESVVRDKEGRIIAVRRLLRFYPDVRNS